MAESRGWLIPKTDTPPARVRIAALGGDGIGPEVVGAAVRCLRALGPAIEVVEPPHGRATLDTEKSAFPPAARAACLESDAILFGAAERDAIPILRFLRLELDCYANLRPVTHFSGVPAVTGKPGVDLVIVRELTEGLYPGREGTLADFRAHWPDFKDRLGRPVPAEGRFAIRVITEAATSRVARYASQLAQRRRGRITIVTKANVLQQTDGLFREVAEKEIAKSVEVDHLYVDEAARRLVSKPESFDVILTSNLFGDILSDVACEAMGGLPVAPSAAIGDNAAYFEPVHGSAPDIAGSGKANPTAAILSAAMLLAYLGLAGEADRLERAVIQTIAAGVRTADLGGELGTAVFTDRVLARLETT